MPAPHEQHRGKEQPRRQPDPHAGPLKRGEEAEPDRQADAGHPVAEDRDPHRHARVLQSAQGPCGDRLHPVGQLEDRGQHQILQRKGDQRGIGGRIGIDIDPQQCLGEQYHRPRGQRHEACADRDGDPARAPHAHRIARAVMVAHPDRGRLTHAERHLEGKACQLQRDRVPGQFRRAEPAHQECGGAENPRLGGDGERNRRADREQLAHPQPVGRPQPAEDVIAVQPPVHPDREDIAAEREEGGDDRRHRRAAQTHCGRTQLAEDEGVIGDPVDEDAKPGDRGGEQRAAQRRDEIAQHARQQHRHHREHDDAVIFVGKADDFGLLARQSHDRVEQQAHAGAENPRRHRQPQGHPHRAAHRAQRRRTRAHRLGDQRRDRSGQPGQRPQHQPEQRYRQRGTGKLVLAQPRDEDHVDRIGQHLQQVRSRQRPRDAQRRAQFLPPAGRRERGRLCHARIICPQVKRAGPDRRDARAWEGGKAGATGSRGIGALRKCWKGGGAG